uniref:Uncharacterized protein n=1 Tax=Globisporangium ultimum (strain ATCC 200006 / CBS 805.95 / DAOM BR144) TaxID=431595 RepID=K3XC51_GLOUD
MAKHAPPHPAAHAAPKEGKVEEPVPPTPAPEPETTPCPYLIPLDAFHQIFDASSGNANVDRAPLSTAARVQLLQEALGVQHADANPRTAAWVEFCFGVLCFARDEPACFESNEKVLTVLTIANYIFQFTTAKGATAEGDDNDASPSTLSLPSVQSCYNKFRERVREVSCPPPPPHSPPTASSQDDTHASSDPVLPSSPSPQLPPPLAQLSTSEVASFVTFMSATFFRHLRAYQFLFTRTQASVTREVDVHIETPFPPPPLAAATLLPDP